MKTVVVYKSKSGYTRTYAEWIAKELGADLKENNKLRIEEVSSYDTIIYGGGMYAGGINGLKFVKYNYEQLKDKNIAVWATGANPGRPEEMQAVWEKHFSPEQLAHIKTFYLRGGFDISLCSKGDKLLMNLLKSHLKKKENSTEDAKGIISMCETPVDFRDKKNIEELCNWVRSLQKNSN